MDLEKKLTDELCNWFNINKLPMSLSVDLDLDPYLKAGIIGMKDLEEGYYLGKCRNSIVAYWNPKINKFEHTRDKFGSILVETIPHLEEPNYTYDMFVPIRKMNINEVNKNNNIELWKHN